MLTLTAFYKPDINLSWSWTIYSIKNIKAKVNHSDILVPQWCRRCRLMRWPVPVMTLVVKFPPRMLFSLPFFISPALLAFFLFTAIFRLIAKSLLSVEEDLGVATPPIKICRISYNIFFLIIILCTNGIPSFFFWT